MTNDRFWLRKLVAPLPRLGLAGWLAWCGSLGFAQESPAPAGPVRTYLNKATIQLPIIIDERSRPHLQGVQLWVKDGPTAAWRLCDKAPPTQREFTFRAPQEGEYWFNIVSIDRAGRASPADVTREAPALIVTIDTQPRQVEVFPAHTTPEGHFIRFQCRDPHLDVFKSRFLYQTADMVWRPLDAVPGKSDLYCVPAQANWTGNVRAVAVDLAGNVTTREMHLTMGQPVVANSAPNQFVGEPVGLGTVPSVVVHQP
ncbi:MAG: hypothetical protein NZO58_08425, partial [Gemmataceae bacterium]|nr:hypothetical protein [Gemmataceae bacterium]